MVSHLVWVPCPGVGSGGAAKVASVRRGWGLPVPDTAGAGSSHFHSGPMEATAEPASKAGGTSGKAYPRKGKPLHGSKESVRNSLATGRSAQEEGEEEGQLQVPPWGDQGGAGGRRTGNEGGKLSLGNGKRAGRGVLVFVFIFSPPNFILIGKKLN